MDVGIPFALKYSVLCISSMTSKASASSFAKACSSSYSPGRPMRSRKMRPEDVYRKKYTMRKTRAMRTADPNDESRPMTTPFMADRESSGSLYGRRMVSAVVFGTVANSGWVSRRWD